MKVNSIISHLIVLVIGAAIGYLIANNRGPAKNHSDTKEAIPEAVVAVVGVKDQVIKSDSSENPVGALDSTNGQQETEPSTVSQQNGNECFASEELFSKKLSFFSEKLEAKKLWYDSNNPDKFQDNSGIFHRVSEFVKSECNQYDYPGQTHRGINVIKWYAARNGLTVIKSRENAIAQRDRIKPGSVMFFGKSGQNYSDLTLDKVTVDGADRIYAHVGVVTEVRKDQNGKVEGYVMMHGRADGYVAERTHYHAIKPAGYGMPPLGNYNQQWIAIADITMPKTDMVELESPPIHDDIPVSPGTPSIAKNSPDPNALSCFDGGFDKFFPDVALSLQEEKIPYKVGPNSDCSGIVFRVCNKVSQKNDNDCNGNFVMPCEDGYKDSRRLARWYHEKGNLQVVTNPDQMGDLIKVGSVMFYGQNGKSYGKNISINDLEKQGKGIQHVGVVVKVNRDENTKKVTSYELFHGHGAVQNPADITKPLAKKNQSIRKNRKSFSYWEQQWVAVAPNILTASN